MRGMAEPRGHTLLTELLRVANRALEAHEGELPWGEVTRRTTEHESPTFGVAIFGEDAGVPLDRYAIRVQRGRLEVVSRDEVPTIDWRVSVDFLRHVARHPDGYIADPAKLELGWLLRRLGISS